MKSKELKIIFLFCVSLFLLSACKKEYSCWCKTENRLDSTSVQQMHIIHATKKGVAKQECEGNGWSSGSMTYSCELR